MVGTIVQMRNAKGSEVLSGDRLAVYNIEYESLADFRSGTPIEIHVWRGQDMDCPEYGAIVQTMNSAAPGEIVSAVVTEFTSHGFFYWHTLKVGDDPCQI